MPWSFGQLKYRLPFKTPSWFPTTNNHFQIKKTFKITNVCRQTRENTTQHRRYTDK